MSEGGSKRWTVEQLIEFAQNMDLSYHKFGNDGVFDKRRMAFGARKWARTKVMQDVR